MRRWREFIGATTGFVSQPLGYGMAWYSLMDGPCSGVWGPIEPHCHANVVLWVAGSLLVPALIFRRLSVGLATCLGFVSSFAMLEIMSLASGNGSRHFGGGFYRPILWDVWIGLYPLVAIALMLLVVRVARRNDAFHRTYPK